MFLRELHVICFQSMWFGYISKGGPNPLLTNENIVICSQIDMWHSQGLQSQCWFIHRPLLELKQSEYTELWQCKPRTVGSHLFIVYWELANINKGWEVKREKNESWWWCVLKCFILEFLFLFFLIEVLRTF